MSVPLTAFNANATTVTRIAFNKSATGTMYYDEIKFINVGSSASPSMRIVHTDHLGGTHVVTDSSGTVVQTLDYYPYGEARVNQGSYTDQRGFTGHETDSSSNLSYMKARYYSGVRGQFLSQDAIFWKLDSKHRMLLDPQQQNSYAYARGNPVRFIDPTGNGILSATFASLTRQLNSIITTFNALVASLSSPSGRSGGGGGSSSGGGGGGGGSVQGATANPSQNLGSSQVSVRVQNERFADVEERLVNKRYMAERNGPDEFDCSGAVVYGIWESANPNFVDKSANELYKNYSTPSDSGGRGTVTFYDWSDNGTMDHVTTSLGNGEALHGSGPDGTLFDVVSAQGLADWTIKHGGTVHPAQLNWDKIVQ